MFLKYFAWSTNTTWFGNTTDQKYFFISSLSSWFLDAQTWTLTIIRWAEPPIQASTYDRINLTPQLSGRRTGGCLNLWILMRAACFLNSNTESQWWCAWGGRGRGDGEGQGGEEGEVEGEGGEVVTSRKWVASCSYFHARSTFHDFFTCQHPFWEKFQPWQHYDCNSREVPIV